MSTRNTIIGVIAVILVIAGSRTDLGSSLSGIGRLATVSPSDIREGERTSLPPGRTPENPISQEAIPVPEEVSSINAQSQGFFGRLFKDQSEYTPIADTLLPPEIRKRLTTILSVFEILSPAQIRFGGPAVLQRLREGNVALLSPNILAVYKNTEEGKTGIGGNLFSQEAWTGPFTETECGVGFYEVVTVGGVDYCDVIRYDFYTDNPEDPKELEKSIAIALSVTKEQYCDAECTQPACKAVCEAIGADFATAYLWEEEFNICGCGQPVYTASCFDTDGDGFGDACVQEPGGDGQSMCHSTADCTQTFRGCLENACVELRGSADIPGIAQCDTDLDCLPTEIERQTHFTCLGFQCVEVPEPGEDECGSAAPWELPCEDQCILETVTVVLPDGTVTTEEICERPALRYTCLNSDTLKHVAKPELQEILWSEVEPWGVPGGPQCALVRCFDENGSLAIEPSECTSDCLGVKGLPDDGQCGYESHGPTDLSSTAPLVDFPWVIDGSEFDPPELPELFNPGPGGGGGGGLFPTCSDSSGDGIWDSCTPGGESGIQCATPADCDRLEHSACVGEQCMVIAGPGINSCGDPQGAGFNPADHNEECVLVNVCPLAPVTSFSSGWFRIVGGVCTQGCSYIGAGDTRTSHSGFDIRQAHGAPVSATATGQIVSTTSSFPGGSTCDATPGGLCGNSVNIYDPIADVTFRYCHLQSVNVSVGQTVTAGTLIGQNGCTGTASSPHIHFSYLLGRQTGNGNNSILVNAYVDSVCR